MESFFFNITDTSYKVEKLFEVDEENYIKRVDISNGVLFLEIRLDDAQERRFNFSNLDRMLVISVMQEGDISLYDRIAEQKYTLTSNSVDIYLSSKQEIDIELSKDHRQKVFVLCIADFILKRYLSGEKESVIDYLYNSLQEDIALKRISRHSIDAISLYIIDKIKAIKSDEKMKSLVCEDLILEFMIHRFKLLDIDETPLKDDEICITNSAKDILLKSFANPPTIDVLAHLCATNETKLKYVFKKRYKCTIYSYIQDLRLQKANLLLKEQNLTIGEIAKEVGYKHQGHFSKLFFQHYNIYPKELLKK